MVLAVSTARGGPALEADAVMFLLHHAAASLALVVMVAAAAASAHSLRPAAITATVTAAGILFYAATVLCGYTLSALGLFGSAGAWFAASLCVIAITFALSRSRRPRREEGRPSPTLSPAWTCSPWLYPGLVAGCAAVAGILVVNLMIVSQVAPHTWDVMVYHLTRMAYFLQQGSLDWYPANYWSQIQHAKNAATLDALVYLAFWRHDSFVQAVQFGAYLLSGFATYAMARLTGAGRPASLVATLAFLLSINVVLESSTAQNDLLLTGCLAGGLLFLWLYLEERRPAWLLLCAVAIGLALGTKASALGVLPSLALLGICASLDPRRHPLPPRPPLAQILALGATAVALIALFSLPAGYVDNLLRYGHPLGDRQVQIEHTFQGRARTEVVHETVVNSARLAADLVRLDGLPDRDLAFRVGAATQAGVRLLFAATGVRLDAAPTGVPFGLGIETLEPAQPQEWSFVGMHEDWSFIGPLNLLLIVPSAILGLVFCRRRPLFWGSLVAGGLLLVMMAARPYQPFLGRFFTVLPVLLAPSLALVVDRLALRALPALWISVSLIIGAVSAAHAVRHRSASPFPEVLKLSRIQQLTRQHPALTRALQRYEQLVPEGAGVITVLRGDSYEYPFFGDRLTRQLIPGGQWPMLPPQRDGSEPTFLIYNHRVEPLECDEDLGAGYRLRRLSICSP